MRPVSTVATMPQAFVPRLLGERAGRALWELAAGLSGIVLLSVLAQVTIPLPWTPVPITGQTFGVTLIALLYGKRGVPVVLSYLALGAAGLPVFAAGKAGLAWGPTVGYLIGMVFSAGIAGFLADKGFTKTWPRAMLAGFLGSVAVFTCGLIVLAQFVPASALLAAGLWPFVPGDLIKTTTAAFVASRANRRP